VQPDHLSPDIGDERLAVRAHGRVSYEHPAARLAGHPAHQVEQFAMTASSSHSATAPAR